MVLDQVFGQLAHCNTKLELDMGYMEESKEILSEMSMDLDDFKFDFDSISDSLGPWIQPNDLKLDTDSDMKDDDSFFSSDSLDFEDLNISEAVRYDCMWSSTPATPVETTKQICENTLFEEFLKIIDSPSQYELDIKEENIELETKPEPASDPCDKHIDEEESKVRIFSASLDHCYVSSSIPGSTIHQFPTNLLDTPPESSEDEDTQTVPFPHLLNPAPSTRIQSQSLLKSSRPRSGGEAKFCFRVKLKSDKSRSVLKQKLKLVHAPVKRVSLGIMNKNMVQTSVRRRKEESLKIKHHEAREIHNHMERQRRNELKVAFDELKACIPDIATSEKVSKQMILDTALQNCKLLRSKEVSMRLRIEKLRKTNAELKQKLRSLQGLC